MKEAFDLFVFIDTDRNKLFNGWITSPNYYSFHLAFDFYTTEFIVYYNIKFIFCSTGQSQASSSSASSHSAWCRTWHIGVCSITLFYRIDQLPFI